MSDYPEHDKMRVIAKQSQTIGEFLAWAQNEKGWALCHLDQNEQEYMPVYKSITVLLAEYFEIDLNRVEDEKRQMLDELRAANDRHDRETAVDGRV